MTDLTFYHAPQTRSSGALVLLEELGAPFHLQVINMKAGEQRQPSYLAINPMGKVPAVRHGETLVTEQCAIYIYLADLFPEKGLAPAINDPQRGAYLRWMVFYGSAFEPAVVDRALKREPGALAMMPYGDYDTTLKTLVDQLGRGPYLLDERFSAADILWGGALKWIVGFGLVPDEPVIRAYIDRVTARPAFHTVASRDAELLAQQDAAAKAA